MGLIDGIANLRSKGAEEIGPAFSQGVETVTTGLQSDGAVKDGVEAVGLPGDPSAESVNGEVSPAGAFHAPSQSTAVSPGVLSFLADPNFSFGKEIGGLIGTLPLNFSQVLLGGAASPATASGEQVISDKVGELTTRIDALMKEAANLDPSTAEGQKRLGEIQLEFSQVSRLLDALTKMLNDFNELAQRIINNL